MRLLEFKIVNCFGFGEKSIFKSDSNCNLYTILGRNSSGKTSLLDAIKSLEFDENKAPNQFERFSNFSNVGNAYLEAQFEVNSGDLTANSIVEMVTERIEEAVENAGGNPDAIVESEQYLNLIEGIRLQYTELISKTVDTIFVRKMPSGNYLFSLSTKGFEASKNRLVKIRKLIEVLYQERNGQRLATLSGKNNIALNFSAEKIENELFKQFPQITYFAKENSLIGRFPDRFTKQDLDEGKYKDNELIQSFYKFIGRKKLVTYLNEEDPDKLNVLEEELNTKIKELEKQINADIEEQDLIEIILHSKNGLQVTFKVDGKPCYYRLLSENTKLYFGYHLYRNVYEFDKDIILLDEPNGGFHASVQVGLRSLLGELASSENTVVFTTHSEYMIDPEDLSGIKLMAKDRENRLYIRNDFHDQPKQSGDYLALQPLMTAIGLQIGNNLNSKKKVIITEGITDMYYLLAFKNVLEIDKELNFVPARGDSTILNIIPLVISQGIAFKVIADINPLFNLKEKLETKYGVEDKYFKDIEVPQNHEHVEDSGIEDVFTANDFMKLIDKVNPLDEEQRKLFKNDSNLHIVKKLSKDNENLKKIIAFNIYSQSKKLRKDDFEESTINGFQELITFCKNRMWKKY